MTPCFSCTASIMLLIFNSWCTAQYCTVLHWTATCTALHWLQLIYPLAPGRKSCCWYLDVILSANMRPTCVCLYLHCGVSHAHTHTLPRAHTHTHTTPSVGNATDHTHIAHNTSPPPSPLLVNLSHALHTSGAGQLVKFTPRHTPRGWEGERWSRVARSL